MIRDIDERRVRGMLRDEAGTESVDYLSDVLASVARTRQRQIEVVVEDQDQPLIVVESPERLRELIAGRGLGALIRNHLEVERQELDLDRPAAIATELVVAGVHEEAAEPGVEPIGVADDEAGDGIETSDGRAGEQRERLLITCLRP